MKQRVRKGLLAVLVLGLALTTLPATTTAAGAHPDGHWRGRRAVAQVSGPILPADGTVALQTDTANLTAAGYVQQEFFAEGTASAYAPTAPLTEDGKWSVAPTTTADYRTRIVVRRPTDPHRFNGIVIVEWFNVTAGFDTSPDWNFAEAEMLRKGYAWVGVSAQFVAVESPPLSLKVLSPDRYESLVHPGDEYSYDIFSQIGRAVQSRHGSSALGGLRGRTFIADGESQSASRLTTYVNAIAPRDRIFDGYLIHSRSAGASSLSTEAIPPVPTFIRTDLREPVMVVESETDVPRYQPARQADSRGFRQWEIAGTSHVDESSFGPTIPPVLGCDLPVNRGPHRYVFRAAVRHLAQWIKRPWAAPPSSPLLELNPDGSVRQDADGNALGGIRTPQLDVPIAAYSGIGSGGTGFFCTLFGRTFPFTDQQVLDRYGSRDNYVIQYLFAEADALQRRFVLDDDGSEILAEALLFPFPS